MADKVPRVLMTSGSSMISISAPSLPFSAWRMTASNSSVRVIRVAV